MDIAIDLRGESPCGPEGVCFRATNKSWPAIRLLVGEFCTDLINDEQFLLGINPNSLFIDDNQARRIGDRIVRMVSTGAADTFALASANGDRPGHPMPQTEPDVTFDLEHLAKFVVFCRNSGGFHIA